MLCTPPNPPGVLSSSEGKAVCSFGNDKAPGPLGAVRPWHGNRASGRGPPRVSVAAMGMRLVIIMYTFCILPSRNVLFVNINDSMLICNSMNLGGEEVCLMS